MDERFANGILGGIIAGVFKDIPNAFFHNWLKITGLSFWDYSGFIALYRHPRGFGEQLYALAFEVLFRILIGLIYIYLMAKVETTHYLIRGAIYGAIVWFAVHAGVFAFHIHQLMKMDMVTSAVNSVCSIIYGWLLAYVIHYLEERRLRPDSKK